MRLTKKLLGFLHRVFNKDPVPFLALRLRYGGGLTWMIADARLTTVPVGGIGAALSVDLRQYTLGQLVNHLAAQPGYTVEYADTSELSLLSAAVLIDGAGDIALSNGDHLYGYTSVLLAYAEAHSVELEEASTQITEMLDQMVIATADGEWLDELGSYYAVPRLQGEVDASYSVRMIAEVLRPRANNVAMEAAIRGFTGQATTVRDVTLYAPSIPIHDSATLYDGSHLHNSAAAPVYGLFDVEYGYDLLGGGDIAVFKQTVFDLVGRLRDAGTHARSLLLKGSEISDNFTPPSDVMVMAAVSSTEMSDTLTSPTETLAGVLTVSGMTDTLTAPLDGLAEVVVTSQFTYSGLRSFNGDITFRGASTSSENI